jgi:hypothetical protein
MADQQLTEPDPEPEVVDGVVVREPAVALIRGALRMARGPRTLRISPRRGGRGRLDVIATRTFLVDVHLVDRR